jgi:hypothetical protein
VNRSSVVASGPKFFNLIPWASIEDPLLMRVH